MRLGKLLSCTVKSVLTSYNSTIGYSILKIHLISSGMIWDFRCSTNAPGKNAPDDAARPGRKGLVNERRASACIPPSAESR